MLSKNHLKASQVYNELMGHSSIDSTEKNGVVVLFLSKSYSVNPSNISLLSKLHTHKHIYIQREREKVRPQVF